VVDFPPGNNVFFIAHFMDIRHDDRLPFPKQALITITNYWDPSGPRRHFCNTSRKNFFFFGDVETLKFTRGRLSFLHGMELLQ
jgi:hypothetical protein